VLESAVSESVTGRVTVALAESLRSEVQASLIAAGAARQAGERRQEELHREIATVRQEQTTRELLEIVASHLTGT
jgi:F0F1-type ATP synthase gamma subunit